MRDLADELVRQKRLTPWVEWAGGEVLEAAMMAANRAEMETQF